MCSLCCAQTTFADQPQKYAIQFGMSQIGFPEGSIPQVGPFAEKSIYTTIVNYKSGKWIQYKIGFYDTKEGALEDIKVVQTFYSDAFLISENPPPTTDSLDKFRSPSRPRTAAGIKHLDGFVDIGEKENHTVEIREGEMNSPAGAMAKIANTRVVSKKELPPGYARPTLYDNDYIPDSLDSTDDETEKKVTNKIYGDSAYLNSLELAFRYKLASFEWDIASAADGGGYVDPGSGMLLPNVISELQWKDLAILELSFDGIFTLGDSSRSAYSSRPRIAPTFRFWGALGLVEDGQTQDSDYAGNNRSLEWSRSLSSSEGGDTLDLNGAFGIKITLVDRYNQILSVMPYLGYGYHEINLTTEEGNQVVSDQQTFDAWTGQVAGAPGYITLPTIGPFAGLNSSYDAEWKGFILGGRFEYEIYDLERRPFVVAYLDALYRIDEYSGEGNWNLRTDLAQGTSFEHTADSTGYDIEAGIEIYQHKRQYGLTFSLGYGSHSSSNGNNTFFMATGSNRSTRLNGVEWEYVNISIGLIKHF